MENLGNYFLKLRQEKGYSYQDIFNQLRLEEGKIKAIEENNLYKLGNYGLAKALFYNYAIFLEADVEAVMQKFEILMPDSARKSFVPRKEIKEKKILISTNLFWTIGILIIVAILGAILIHSYNNGKLRPMELFKKEKVEKAEKKEKKEVEEPQPEKLRQRMIELSDKEVEAKKEGKSRQEESFADDDTDYIGNVLGESPINISIE